MTTLNRMMERTRLLLVVLLSLVLALPSFAGGRKSGSGGDVYVRGYTRKDGTYVQPHYRSAPDGNFYNNWSTKGNVNPHTGQPGTKMTPPPGYGGYGLRGYSTGVGYASPGYAYTDPATRAYAARAAAGPDTPVDLAQKIYLMEGTDVQRVLKITSPARWDTDLPNAGELRLPVDVKNDSPYLITRVEFRVCFFKDGIKAEERLVEGFTQFLPHGTSTTPLRPGQSGMFVVQTRQRHGATGVSVEVVLGEGLPVRR
jgi:hypothetical protein